MKTLKFAANLVPLVLSGEKNVTWRLWDDKNLKKGDVVRLIKRPELKEFANAKLIAVKEIQMGNLSNKDKQGHEKFESDKEMYKTYTNYYGKEVNKDTPVKIIRFKLIQ